MRSSSITVIFLTVISLILVACSFQPVEMVSPTPLALTRQEPAPEVSYPGQLPEFVEQSYDIPLQIISLTSPVNPTSYATLIIETLPGVECSAIVDYGPSGITVLRTRTPDSGGKISWTWLVGKFSGTWQITVRSSYGGKSASVIAPFTVR